MNKMKNEEAIEIRYLLKYPNCEFCNGNENGCEFLSPSEEKQTSKKEFHICSLFNKRVYHFNKHPFLPRLKECIAVTTALSRQKEEIDEEQFKIITEEAGKHVHIGKQDDECTVSELEEFFWGTYDKVSHFSRKPDEIQDDKTFQKLSSDLGVELWKAMEIAKWVKSRKPFERKKAEVILEKLMKKCLDLGIKIGMKKENYKGDVAPIRNEALDQLAELCGEKGE